MKRLLLLLTVFSFWYGCSYEDKPKYSAIADFIGEWKLEIRTLNNSLPIESGEESLIFSEDNNFEDLIGRYTLTSDTETSGLFFVTGLPYDLNFESTSGELLTSSFNILDGILTLEYQNNNGDNVREIWRKAFYHETE
ncbi:hypothetical protein [Winogradskyella alexanderae]|uniref:Lipocalin-like domain-containing protein n=1 Tax=Winogradskyella alexanderae TaxID=2877123 RepID=A0ABS7XST6_9FLAO|nr:hypothetical protein [Winogradskyella alexanderae]MCA0132840.1 hypothetical protein [Winogradskyella alexanderae]